MSQSGSWVPKGVDQRAREAAREAAVSEGLTLGEYLDRLMKAPASPQPNEVPHPRDSSGQRTGAASEAIEKLTRRIEASEARSAMAISSMDQAIHDLVGRLENTEQTAAAIAGHVEGVIDQLRETHEALKQKVRRLEEENSHQENLEALKALEAALGKLASHVHEENALAHEEAQAIKGRVESGFLDIIERVESMETRLETGLADTARQVKEGVEQASLRAAGTARLLTERLSAVESRVEDRLSLLSRDPERLDAAETRLESVESDLAGALESVEVRFDRIQERLNRAETTTDAALKNLESSFSSLDERIDEVSSRIDPDLAGRLRGEFEARFEDMMKSVRETVDTARQELAEEISRAAGAPAGEAIAELKEQLESVQERLDASEARHADAIEMVSGQVASLNETVDARLREVEARGDAAASEAVREEIDRLGRTVSGRIDELADELAQRVSDSEARSASAIEQIGDQVAAATNRLQARQNEAIRTLAEQVDENRRKADARLSDALASVSDRLEQMQAHANASLSPVQKAIAMLAARLESLEDSTWPDLDRTGTNLFGSGAGLDVQSPAGSHETSADGASEDFEPFEDFAGFGTFDDPESAARAGAEMDADGDDAVAFEEDLSGEPGEPHTEEDETFEAGIESWEDGSPDDRLDVADDHPETDQTGFEDDFDAIRAAVEGLSFAHQAAAEEEADAPGAADETAEPFEPLTAQEAGSDDALDVLADEGPENDLLDPLADEGTDDDPLAGFDEFDDARTEARESDIFDDEEFEDGPPVMGEEPDAGIEAEAEAETEAGENKPLDPDTNDYLARARKAAMAASFGRGGGQSARPGVRTTAAGGSSRLPLIAAASAVAVAGVTAGGYLYIRGKQAQPVQEAPASTYVDPGAPELAEATAAATAADDLFEPVPAVDAPAADAPAVSGETAAAMPAVPAYDPIPPVVSVEAAAASGNAIAQYQLAQDKLAAGEIARGADLMRRAAEKGLPIAQYALAKLHEKGTGVPKDLSLARQWTEKAAKGGNVKAMHDLAVFMAEGEGGEQTYAGAVEWFRKGAEYGVVDSQYNLGVLYEQGLGISPNLTESLFWFDVASRNGDGGAPAKIGELMERVSPEAAAQARTRASIWTPSEPSGVANGRFGAQPWNLGNPLQVRAIQKALNALGYNAGIPDGIMGSATSQAIREYQSSHNLPVTGTVTPTLIESLNAGATPG